MPLLDPTVAFNPISRIDPPARALAAVTGVGAGGMVQFSQPRRYVSMQVSYTGAPTTVKANLEGSNDGSTWFALGVFDTGAGGVNGGMVAGSGPSALFARANLVTLTGGTSPTVTASISGAS